MRSLRPCLAARTRICATHNREPQTTSLARTSQRTSRSSLHTAPRIDSPATPRSRLQDRRHFQPWPLEAWNQDVQFISAEIVSNTPTTDQVHRVRVNIGEGIQSYSKAGQFIQIKTADAKPAFMAIASPPKGDVSVVDLLVKCSGDTASLLCTSKSGDAVEVTEVMGKGFAIERLPADEVPDVWMFATGTGIAPIQALLESPSFEISKRNAVHLYYGAKNAETNPVSQELENWKNNFPNLTIHLVYSDSGDGYIQDLFEKEMPNLDGGRSGVLLCGQRDMCERVTALMTQAGVAADRILLNF